jgi:hypothetical protein
MSDEVENEDPTEEFEVVELESEDGTVEEFVVIDRVKIQDTEYAIMAVLEDMENMESMDEEEFQEMYGDDDLFFIMRQVGEEFEELDEDEYNRIKDELDKELEARGL